MLRRIRNIPRNVRSNTTTQANLSTKPRSRNRSRRKPPPPTRSRTHRKARRPPRQKPRLHRTRADIPLPSPSRTTIFHRTVRTTRTAETAATTTTIPATGARPVSVNKIYTQGNFKETGGSLDLVIEGDGFFQVTMPDGTVAYARAGSFSKDSTGRVVTSDGYPMEPPLTIPADATSVTIGTDGTTTVTSPGSTAVTEI